MKKLAVLLIACVLFWGAAPTAYASEFDCENGDFLTYSNQGHEHCYEKGEGSNNTTIINNKVDREDPAGVGVDLLLVEGEKVDLVAEYKYDFENEEHSTFGVFKTKVALWDVIKGFFKKEE